MINAKPITKIKTLKHIENCLPQISFLRVHNSWIIKTKYLKKYHRGKHSRIEMENGSIVEVSKRRKNIFFDFLNE